MYIWHIPLFSFNTLMQYQPKNCLAMVFASIDLHPFLKALPIKSVRGPKGYSSAALIKAFLAMRLCSIHTVTLLVEHLKTDLVFRYECGFSILQPVPSLATFSHFFQKIAETDSLQALFSALAPLNLMKNQFPKKILRMMAAVLPGALSLIPMVINIHGLTINYTWQSIPKANCL